MNSRKRSLVLVAAAIGVAVALFFVLRQEGESDVVNTTTTSPKEAKPPVVIEMVGGEPVGGPRTLEYPTGETVRFTVVPDGSIEEIHVHGYDIAEAAEGEKPLKFTFIADLEGSYEIEAHTISGSHSLVATLEVGAG